MIIRASSWVVMAIMEFSFVAVVATYSRYLHRFLSHLVGTCTWWHLQTLLVESFVTTYIPMYLICRHSAFRCRTLKNSRILYFLLPYSLRITSLNYLFEPLSILSSNRDIIIYHHSLIILLVSFRFLSYCSSHILLPPVSLFHKARCLAASHANNYDFNQRR